MSLFDFIDIFLVGFRNDEVWTTLGFHIGLGNIFTHNAKTEELDATNKQHDADL